MSINRSIIQHRVSSSCPIGSSIRVINIDGTVDCETDDNTNSGGDITSINVDGGLVGGGIFGDVNMSINRSIIQHRVSSSCPIGSSIRVINIDGTVDCEIDDNTNSGGDITSINVDGGLVGGGIFGDVNMSINRSIIQQRIRTKCSVGEYIREVKEDGTVVCGSPNASITELNRELEAMKSTLSSIQSLISPLIDRATKQLHSVVPVASMLVYENTLPILRLEEAASGDFISFLPIATSGCSGASNNFLVVDEFSSVKINQGLNPGTYKICHALKSFGSNVVQNYWEQTAKLTVFKNPFSDLSVFNADGLNVQKNVEVHLDVSGNATEGDIIAFVAKTSIGCTGATNATKIVLQRNTSLANYTFGTSGHFKVCYSENDTGEDEDRDYSELGLTFNVLDRQVHLNIPNASSSVIAAKTAVYIEIVSPVTGDGEVVTMATTDALGAGIIKTTASFI